MSQFITLHAMNMCKFVYQLHLSILKKDAIYFEKGMAYSGIIILFFDSPREILRLRWLF